jgi:acyl-CoA thioesterase-2
MEKLYSVALSLSKKTRTGLEHEISIPDVPSPEELKDEIEIREIILKKLNIDSKDMPMFLKQREIEMRPVEIQDYFEPKRMPPYKNTWIKPKGHNSR